MAKSRAEAKAEQQAAVLCSGPCRQHHPPVAYVVKLWGGRTKRRTLCPACWRQKEAERRAEERLRDIEHAKTDESPFGLARREVEATTATPAEPLGVPMNDWYERGLTHLHHLHYEVMHRIWSDREEARQQRLTRAREADLAERVREHAERVAREQHLLPTDGLLEGLEEADADDDLEQDFGEFAGFEDL